MKHIITILVLGTLGYFGYIAYQNAQEPVQPATGTITDTYQKINNTLENTKDIAAIAGLTEQDLIDAGLSDVIDNASKEALIPEEVSNEPQELSAGDYISYNNTDLSSLEGKIVLDFSAPWCPSCRKLEKDINNSLMDIPAGVTLLKVDYDSETALKVHYGVTRQHTLVQVDQAGNMIKKWSGGNTLESIINELQ
jgi:thiol-disulfide isomerase/thioredoxin